eukprot:m.37258 g.37258  ORF g.37258 m.37258 type:complete len:137 (-) comp9288_c0_seq2:6-416(-)
MSDIVLPLILCLVGFILAAGIIIICMYRKYRQGSADLNPFLSNDGDLYQDPEKDKDMEKDVSIGDTDAHTRAIFVIPHALQLLKTCKALTHRLLAWVIDGTSQDSSRLLGNGNIKRYVEPSIVTTMNPPFSKVLLM